MKQHEFIWKVSSNTDMKTIQTVNGITECTVKNDIIISHNYKKNNQIILELKEFSKKYLIISDAELNEILRIINSGDNIIQPLIEYADKSLTKL